VVFSYSLHSLGWISRGFLKITDMEFFYRPYTVPDFKASINALTQCCGFLNTYTSDMSDVSHVAMIYSRILISCILTMW